jgi:hypothetical protein
MIFKRERESATYRVDHRDHHRLLHHVHREIQAY